MKQNRFEMREDDQVDIGVQIDPPALIINGVRYPAKMQWVPGQEGIEGELMIDHEHTDQEDQR